jgi:hypothetical protein
VSQGGGTNKGDNNGITCVKGTVLNWSLYLLNLFLDDCQDAQDLGTKLHYLWLLIIIALVGWRHPKYTVFFQRIENCCTTQYETLWHTSITKERKTNSSIFVTYFEEIHEKVVETWRIPPEVVEEHKDIPNFQVSRHNVWIQAKRDPKKNWLQMRYCSHWRGSSMGHERLVQMNG